MIRIATYAEHCVRAGQVVPESYHPDWWEEDEDGHLNEHDHDYRTHEWPSPELAKDWLEHDLAWEGLSPFRRRECLNIAEYLGIKLEVGDVA